MRSSKSAPKLPMKEISLNKDFVPKKIDLMNAKSKSQATSNIIKYNLLSTNKKTQKQNINYLKTEYITKFKATHPFYNVEVYKPKFNTDLKVEDKIPIINNIANRNKIRCEELGGYDLNRKANSKSINIIPKKFCFDDIEIKNHFGFNITTDENLIKQREENHIKVIKVIKETKITDYFHKKKNIIIPNIKKFDLFNDVHNEFEYVYIFSKILNFLY